MRTPAYGLAAILMVMTAACAQKSIAPTSFTPAYKSRLEAPEVVVVKECAAASAVSVEDGLNGPVVGKRSLEDSSFPAQNISINGDKVGWIRAAASEMFKKASLKTTSSGAPSVKLRLSAIDIHENVHVNAGYDARVTLEAAVVNAAGRECWNARKSGASQDYGNYGSAEIYTGLVDHALDRALMSVAGDAGFQDALCSDSCRSEPPKLVPASSSENKRPAGKRKK